MILWTGCPSIRSGFNLIYRRIHGLSDIIINRVRILGCCGWRGMAEKVLHDAQIAGAQDPRGGRVSGIMEPEIANAGAGHGPSKG